VTSPSPTVLVTGAAGFLGRYIIRHFAAEGWSVVGIGKSAPENALLANLAAYYQLKLPDPFLTQLLQEHKPQVCIHCAGGSSVGLSLSAPATDFHANTVLTFELLNALRLQVPECRFIFLSSAAVYGNPESLPVSESQHCAPLSPYGFHKWQCEQLCLEFTKLYNLPTACVRIFSAYGSGLRRQVLWDICQKVITHNTLRLQGTGQESRDFIHAVDIAQALLLIATTSPMQAQIYNLGSAREVTIQELASMAVQALGYQGNVEFDGQVPSGHPLNWQADLSALKALGFVPSMPLEQGVYAFANWCRVELVG